MKGLILAVAMTGTLAVSAHAMAAPEDPSGVWRMADGKVTVEIAPCGKYYCGKVVGLAKPLDKHGRPKRDRKNPNPALRSRPVIGLTILYNVHAAGDNRWDGVVYNADDGHTYSGHFLRNGDRATLKACVAFLCKSIPWVKVD